MTFTEKANKIFNQAIRDYHLKDHVDTPINNPYELGSIEYSLYLKCWIDTVQWHLEDIIRDPHINPAEALGLKRRIDRSNQDRTDLVEEIDSYFRQLYSEVKPLSDARLKADTKTVQRETVLPKAKPIRSDLKAAEGGHEANIPAADTDCSHIRQKPPQKQDTRYQKDCTGNIPAHRFFREQYCSAYGDTSLLCFF